jgi:hypothetical protein
MRNSYITLIKENFAFFNAGLKTLLLFLFVLEFALSYLICPSCRAATLLAGIGGFFLTGSFTCSLMGLP